MKQDARFRGALLGLAAGDALGTTLEFLPRGSFREIADMVGGGPFNLEAGQWTDDTSMMLCLAESLIEKRGLDQVDQLERYTLWSSQGRFSSNGRVFDIGNTVDSALSRFSKTRQPYCGRTDPDTAGNGSLMRLAPVPLFYARSHREAIERSGESSRTTHGAQTAIDACRCMGALIVGAVNGASKKELLSNHYSPVEGYWEDCPLVEEIAEIAAGSYKQKNPSESWAQGMWSEA
jgi:ADP-ribosyl-[dinitrogen reductase] hydrolase